MRGLTPILRPLLHHGRMSAAVVAGAAVATAVLAGALVVGDSVRGSLRALTLDRLGGIDHALLAQRFVRADLTDGLAATPAVADSELTLAPAIVLRASIRHADSGTRASQVGLQGVDDRFLGLFGDPAYPDLASLIPADGGQPGAPPVALNEALGRALGAEIGDAVLISLKRWSEVPRSSLLGRKDTGDVVETVRLTVAALVPDRGLGRFGLAVSQAAPHNAYVALDVLQRALDQEGTVNAVFARQTPAQDPATVAATLEAGLRGQLELADLGLTIRLPPSPDAQNATTEPAAAPAVATLESDEFILRPGVAQAAHEAARDVGAPVQPALTYLANRIAAGERQVPYSTVAAIDPRDGFPGLRLRDGGAPPSLADDEILLNAWTADDLDAEIGDEILLTFFQIGPREELIETDRRFTVRGITAMTGLGVDRDLVQDYPGIADTDNMADWDPPFPVDLGDIRPTDEDYWDDFGDAPKAFVSLAAGQDLWRSRWGDTTGLRLAPAAGNDLPTTAAAFGDALRAATPLEPLGLAFRAVKAEGLDAAVGATDFAGLFLGFSMFLIVSAALLAALLYRLGVEQRARDLGLELAIGYPLRTLKRRLLAEGGLLAALGALIGVGLAVAYAAAMMHLLRTRWLPAVGTTELRLFVEPVTLAAGAAGAILVVLFSIVWTVRRLGKVPATLLLKGVVAPQDDAPRSTRRARWVAIGALTLAFGLLAFALVTGRTRDAGLFFAIGPLLLVGSLAAFSLLGTGERRAGAPTRPGPGALLRMAAANGGRNRGRSLLSTLLVATASFMIVTVAAFQHDYSRETLDRASGAGGYSLVAEADVALLYDPSDPDGRFELGLPETGPEGEALAAASIVPCRLLPGDDTSCLNLYKPSKPRVLGVPADFIDRGGFTFTQAIEPLETLDNPWTLLDQTLADGAIPAIGDANSMQYILKLPVGGDLILEDSTGAPVTLRLVATLATSIFQSEMVIAESQFLRHFPTQEGFRYLLVETPGADDEAVASVSRTLEAGLVPYGLDAVTTGDKLSSFHAVQNTYLSTFRTLGGLGLLLGTVGLAIVLLRNVLERRGELAAMRAFGFRRRYLTTMIVAENAILLLAGLVIGTVAALVTVAPQAFGAGAHVPWGSIASTLGVVLVVGLVACIVAAAGALRTPLLPALKAE